ncbi:hypothetical protein SteCoe_20848 [Stentor coeruleus]|uniref:Transmembrane protein n=1 Tax=Stentor coeruleus TaxID=5963 RepID=A0A1R2BR38_9CILI|nr:hypothetical protein SteCoe_20848 [Stentor coeruleus]
MGEKEGSLEVEQGETQPLVRSRMDLVNSQQKNLYYSGYGNLPFLIAIAVILGISDDDCDNPIRTWLLVMLIIIAVSLGAAIIETCSGILTKIGAWASIPMYLLMLFNIAWYIVGCVWLFGDDECSSDWLSGYVLTLIMLIFFFVFSGLMVLVICCCCCCVGVLAAGAGAASLAEPNRE